MPLICKSTNWWLVEASWWNILILKSTKMIDDKGSSAKKFLVETPDPNNRCVLPEKTNMEPEIKTPWKRRKIYTLRLQGTNFAGSMWVFHWCSVVPWFHPRIPQPHHGLCEVGCLIMRPDRSAENLVGKKTTLMSMTRKHVTTTWKP